ncbi:MAG TPA: hypothetical protein VHM92_05415 [Allosphingosinicella sp.]|nr:hypothetical protein [Allosphingosinicella sp.]
MAKGTTKSGGAKRGAAKSGGAGSGAKSSTGGGTKASAGSGRSKVRTAARKAGTAAVKIAETPIVSETVAAALMAAAASLAGPPKTRKAAAAGTAQAGTEALKLGDALRRIAIDVARRTLDAWEEAEASRGGGRK